MQKDSGNGTDWATRVQYRGALGYTWEQFFGAVRSLATGHEPLSERLGRAWGYRIVHVQEDDLADEVLGERIAGIKKKLKSLSDLNEEQQSELADQIVSIYNEVSKQLASLDA